MIHFTTQTVFYTRIYGLNDKSQDFLSVTVYYIIKISTRVYYTNHRRLKLFNSIESETLLI